MRSPRMTFRRLLPIILPLAVVGSGLFYVVRAQDPNPIFYNPIQGSSPQSAAPTPQGSPPQSAAPTPTPRVNLDPGGYCCIPSYAYIEGGICAPDTYQSFIGGVKANDADKITEDKCLSGPEQYVYEKGILWNDDSKLCAFLCGQQTNLSYCDPRGTNAYTCVDKPVARQSGDPQTIGFGYRYARNSDIPSGAPAGTTSCEAICVPPADVETDVKCPQACVNGTYVCEITVRNKDNRAALVTSVVANVGWYDTDATPSLASQKSYVSWPGDDDEQYDADDFDGIGTLRWPQRYSLTAPPTEPIEIPVGGAFHARVTVGVLAGQDVSSLGTSFAGSLHEGELSASAEIAGVQHGGFDDLNVSANCGFEGKSECTQGAQSSPYVEYVVTVPEGPASQNPVRVKIPVPDCLDTSELLYENDPWMSNAIDPAGGDPDEEGCWFSETEADAYAGIAGMVKCNVYQKPGEKQLAWYQASALTDDPECASGESIDSIVATIQLPGQTQSEPTDPVPVLIATCGKCDLCKTCMTPDGRPCGSADDGSGRETCETDPRYSPYCRWTPPGVVYREGRPVSTPGRCAPNPEAVDDDTGEYLCDYSYGCCRLLAGPGVSPGVEVTEENGLWSYLFGFVEKGVETQEFTAAKQCVLDADDPDNDIYYATDWARAPVKDAANEYYFPAQTAADTDDFVGKRRAACTEEYSSSSSSASTSSRPRTPGNEHLYCDRRLLGLAAGVITSQQETSRDKCWIRDAQSTKQSPLLGTAFFNPPFYSLDPYDSEGAFPVGYVIGDRANGEECEGRCAAAKNVGVCCRPYKVNEESCPIMMAENCNSQGMILPFEQEHSDTCATWETTCFDADNDIVDCSRPGAISVCEVNVPAPQPLQAAPGLQNPNP